MHCCRFIRKEELRSDIPIEDADFLSAWNPVVPGFFMYPAKAGEGSTDPSAGEEPNADSDRRQRGNESNDGRDYGQDGLIENCTQNQANCKGKQHGKEADQTVNIDGPASFGAAVGTGIGRSFPGEVFGTGGNASFLIAVFGIGITHANTSFLGFISYYARQEKGCGPKSILCTIKALTLNKIDIYVFLHYTILGIKDVKDATDHGS